MTVSAKFPTDKAWFYFLTNLDDIRDCIETFLPVEQWQSMAGPFGDKSKHTLSDFDQAVKNKDSAKLYSIMDDAWGRAPESREVYNIPGFSEMCNLLDGTVEGFIDCGLENEDDDNSAF